EDVDERVLFVARVVARAAAEVRHPDGVAIASDAGGDAAAQVAGAGALGRPEAERVEDGAGARAGSDDVAEDAADAGGSALVGLDAARMVVAIDLERHGPAVADIDDAGVRAGSGEDARAAARQLAEQVAG